MRDCCCCSHFFFSEMQIGGFIIAILASVVAAQLVSCVESKIKADGSFDVASIDVSNVLDVRLSVGQIDADGGTVQLGAPSDVYQFSASPCVLARMIWKNENGCAASNSASAEHATTMTPTSDARDALVDIITLDETREIAIDDNADTGFVASVDAMGHVSVYMSELPKSDQQDTVEASSTDSDSVFYAAATLDGYHVIGPNGTVAKHNLTLNGTVVSWLIISWSYSRTLDRLIALGWPQDSAKVPLSGNCGSSTWAKSPLSNDGIEER